MSADKDELICELFSLLKELSDSRKRYDQCMTEGYVSLAKTRYDMGFSSSGNIGQLQYPNEMKATIHIECDDSSSDVFQVASDSDSETDQPPSSSQLRQRRIKGEVPKQDVGTTGSTTQTTVKSTGIQPEDPIRWFSALPPTSLRNSQKKFKEGLELAVLMASLHSKIDKLREMFIEIMKSDECKEPETLEPRIKV